LIYDRLGDRQNAVDYYGKALPIYRALGNRIGEATTLNNIGTLLVGLGANQQARDAFLGALHVYHEMGLKGAEATALNNLGMVYTNLADGNQAINYYSQAQTIQQQTGDRDGMAKTLNNIGLVFFNLGEKKKALDYFGQALPVATALNAPVIEGLINYNLMETLRGDQPILAIYFGKQAFNLAQQVRGNMQGLDKDLQQKFLASISGGYRELANLLIDQGRLPEAQQVLDQLKEQEFNDYVRGDTSNTLSPLALTPAEQQAEEDYQKSTSQIVALGGRLAMLEKIAKRAPEQETEYQEISKKLDDASSGLNDFYARLFKLFSNSGDANNRLEDVKDREIPQLQAAIAETPRTVALYTLVSGDRYNVIVITGSTPVARKYMIAEKDLNQKVAAFEQALRDPHSDPRPIAQDLYNILIGPVKADLDQAQAETLVWSLDGVLRYVPIAALYDGKQYVVEKYAVVTITPASDPYLADKPDFTNLSAVAMGISRQYESKLPALPAVAGELAEVVSDAQNKNARGVLPGAILLNGAFTETAMEEALDTPHTVVHIASHFVFRPGDDTQSFLLLAGKDQDTQGYHLTVADFRDKRRIALKGTDLLTLSACETGMSGNASNGREVDGLGMTAQSKGAKAVISSLWEVDDASTGALMADFYKRWAGGAGKVPKVEALRQAQLDLLQGNVKAQSGASGRGFTVADNKPSTSTPQAGYAHPFYWAPFVLMGNWR
jgi:CHAT domain-containing protein